MEPKLSGGRIFSVIEVLRPCSECLGENDEISRYCQWCSKSSISPRQTDAQSDALTINEKAIAGRYAEFRTAVEDKASAWSTEATMQLFVRFFDRGTRVG